MDKDDYKVHEATRLESTKSFGFRFGYMSLEKSYELMNPFNDAFYLIHSDIEILKVN